MKISKDDGHHPKRQSYAEQRDHTVQRKISFYFWNTQFFRSSAFRTGSFKYFASTLLFPDVFIVKLQYCSFSRSSNLLLDADFSKPFCEATSKAQGLCVYSWEKPPV